MLLRLCLPVRLKMSIFVWDVALTRLKELNSSQNRQVRTLSTIHSENEYLCMGCCNDVTHHHQLFHQKHCYLHFQLGDKPSCKVVLTRFQHWVAQYWIGLQNWTLITSVAIDTLCIKGLVRFTVVIIGPTVSSRIIRRNIWVNAVFHYQHCQMASLDVFDCIFYI